MITLQNLAFVASTFCWHGTDRHMDRRAAICNRASLLTKNGQ